MSRQSGQAAVETAITMPLLVFMVLGTLQLFMVLQARILAQYAVSRAVRHGAQNFGDCTSMYDAALLVLMPAIDSSFARSANKGSQYATTVSNRLNRHYYVAGLDGGRDGPIVWMDRLTPLVGNLNAATEEETWDLPPHRVLSVRMVFWAPLKIPFANWVFARMALAHWGLRELHSADPLMPVKDDANWTRLSAGPRAELKNELVTRYDLEQYVFPIEVAFATRMMSPARFTQQNCPR